MRDVPYVRLHVRDTTRPPVELLYLAILVFTSNAITGYGEHVYYLPNILLIPRLSDTAFVYHSELSMQRILMEQFVREKTSHIEPTETMRTYIC